MLDETTTDTTAAPEPTDSAPPAPEQTSTPARAPRKRAPRKTAAKKTSGTEAAEGPPSGPLDTDPDVQAPDSAAVTATADEPASEPPAPVKKATRTRKSTAKKAAAAPDPDAAPPSASEPGAAATTNAEGIAPAQAVSIPGLSALPAPTDAPADARDGTPADASEASGVAAAAPATTPLFQPPVTQATGSEAPAPTKRAPRNRAAKKTAPPPTGGEPAGQGVTPDAQAEATAPPVAAADGAPVDAAPTESLPLDLSGDVEAGDTADETLLAVDAEPDDPSESAPEEAEPEDPEGDGGSRRRRRRGGRRRRKSGDGGESAGESAGADESTDARSQDDATAAETSAGPAARDESSDDGDKAESSGSSRRRRRRRRSGDGDESTTGDDPENTVTKVRSSRSAEDEITGFTGSTRLEAKKQRRREGREAGRRRAPIISEAEFLARRESVDRAMVIRQRGELTQIAVLEDNVLVEHYVARESQTSLMGNVYLGRVQNVLPSMEAAFVDIGKGRNAVLYAGEVNWDSFGVKDGQRKIEQVLKSGQTVLVQVTKDPVGHKGARLTSQVSLPGRFLVYVPDGTTSGISRKLPDNERNRLKTLLKEIVPEGAGVIVRTAAEGASEEELTRDVERLTARWEEISSKAAAGNAPQLLYGEPDLTLKVVRDLFTEDFTKLVISGDDAWDLVEGYVSNVAPDLMQRMERHDDSGGDAFSDLRIDEQIAKALDRKVYLPSGGSLVIDRTEAMTVVDVNTGKFTGSGGNLEETVTKNNLEAAEEIVRQLRLRDIGGIIVVDFIDMVLESNRDLVLRRLVECLGRDRTRHQVAEVTSLGLVQMTRKRIGTGLLEAFGEPCECCQGRGLHVQLEPVEDKSRAGAEEPARSGRGARSGRRGRGEDRADGAPSRGGHSDPAPTAPKRPTPADFAAMARAEAAVEARQPEASEQSETSERSEPAHRSDAPESSGTGLVPDATGGELPQAPAEQPAGSAEQPAGSAEQPAGSAVSWPEQPAEPATSEPVDGVARIEGADLVDVRPAEPAPEPEQPALEPEQPQPAAAPAAPRLVTTVRRRGARRPAGPPAGAAGGVAGGAAAGPVASEAATPGDGADRPAGEHLGEPLGGPVVDGIDPLTDGRADGAVPLISPGAGTGSDVPAQP